MKILTAKNTICGSSRRIDLACAKLVAKAKHGRPIVVVMSVEVYERLKPPDEPTRALESHGRVQQ